MAPRATGLKYFRLCNLRIVQLKLLRSGMAPSTRTVCGSTNTTQRAPEALATPTSAELVGVAGGVYLNTVPGCAASAAASTASWDGTGVFTAGTVFSARYR